MNSHNIFNTKEGLFAFGYNLHGQLGLGDSKDRYEPAKLKLFRNIFKTKEGLFTFSYNLHEQLRLGGDINRYEPTKLFFQRDTFSTFLGNSAPEIISIYYGIDHTIINTTDGLYVFGSNNRGQLGLGDRKDRYEPTKLEFFQRVPCGVRECHPFTIALERRVELLEILSISCGAWHTMINTTNGLFVFGANFSGQLGLGDRKDRLVPTLLEFESKNLEIILINCGECYTIINTTDGLYVFGCNNDGGLGLDLDDRYILKPTKLDFLNTDFEILSIDCGHSHTIINTTNGVFVFGYNYGGRLGLGDEKNRCEPTLLEFFNDLEIISIRCGDMHTIINTTDGLYVFGFNQCGQLGLGDTKNRLVPTLLDFFRDLEIISIHCGREHTIIHTTDGVFVFGRNQYGQLGLGDTKNRLVPIKLKGEYEIISFNKKKIKSTQSLTESC